jgi:RNA polymerase sigma-70 factor (ECF subfamily)
LALGFENEKLYGRIDRKADRALRLGNGGLGKKILMGFLLSVLPSWTMPLIAVRSRFGGCGLPREVALMDGVSDTGLNVEQLIESARAGSGDALGQLFELWRPYLLLAAQGELEADLQAKVGASDIVQETFLKAHRDFPRFRGRTQDELLAWLQSILVNSAANVSRRYLDTEMRALAREIPLEPTQETERVCGELAAVQPTPDSEIRAREQAEKVSEAVRRLPEQYQLLLRLRNEEQRTFVDIGRLLDRSPESARKLWFRAVDRLRLELGPLVQKNQG